MVEENLVDMNAGNTESSAETEPSTKAPPTAFWIPETMNYAPGSAADLDQRLKTAGIKLRRELLTTCQTDIDAWTALMNPPSVHTASHTLVEMAMNLPAEDRDLFTPRSRDRLATSPYPPKAQNNDFGPWPDFF